MVSRREKKHELETLPVPQLHMPRENAPRYSATKAASPGLAFPLIFLRPETANNKLGLKPHTHP